MGAAIPTNGPLPESDRVKVETLPGAATVASVVHHGPFATLGQAYGAVFSWIEENGYRLAGPNREVYLQYERGRRPGQVRHRSAVPCGESLTFPDPAVPNN